MLIFDEENVKVLKEVYKIDIERKASDTDAVYTARLEEQLNAMSEYDKCRAMCAMQLYIQLGAITF